MLIDLDLPNLPRILRWHLMSIHPEAELRTSASEKGIHIKIEKEYCSICEIYDDENHILFRRLGQEVLFSKKPYWYKNGPKDKNIITWKNTGNWIALNSYD